MTNPTAAVLIIGNEILSGRTKDANLGWLGEQLAAMGIELQEARVVADDPQAIIEAVNALRIRYDTLFTTGGIGPTHDDITTPCIARALGVPVIRHPEAERILLKHYRPEDVNEARMKMADTPEGATLVFNPVSAAPGYRIDNVYVFAGVPKIMQAMFDSVRQELQGGEPIISRSISVYLPEGDFAIGLAEIQDACPDVQIGSYPMIRSGRLGTSLVLRGTGVTPINAAYEQVKALLIGLNGQIASED